MPKNTQERKSKLVPKTSTVHDMKNQEKQANTPTNQIKSNQLRKSYI